MNQNRERDGGSSLPIRRSYGLAAASSQLSALVLKLDWFNQSSSKLHFDWRADCLRAGVRAPTSRRLVTSSLGVDGSPARRTNPPLPSITVETVVRSASCNRNTNRRRIHTSSFPHAAF